MLCYMLIFYHYILHIIYILSIIYYVLSYNNFLYELYQI